MKSQSKLVAMVIVVIMLLNSNIAESSGTGMIGTVPIEGTQADTGTMSMNRLCNVLEGAKKSDLSFCLGYIKKSKNSDKEIADFIVTWTPDAYKKEIPSVFRSKIDRIVKRLAAINYEQLIKDVDFIKNSQLSTNQMVGLINGTSVKSKK